MGFVSDTIKAPPDPDARFAGHPWATLPEAALGKAADVPSMLSDTERRLYLWLAEHWATGRGAVVDLGAFAGGSTACLAEGVRRSGRQTRVFAFDRFQASHAAKTQILAQNGVEPFDGDDILPLARGLLSPWEPLVTLVPGDIEEATWECDPIEILVIDAAKSARAADRIAETFFPHLVPGRSVVVHQDFLHWKLPWLPAQMEWMSNCFVPVAHCPRDTVVFLCTRTPGPEDLFKGKVQGRHDAVIADALAAMSLKVRDWGLDDKLAAQFRALARNPKMRRSKDFTVRP